MDRIKVTANSERRDMRSHRVAWMNNKPTLVAFLASAPVLAAEECYDLLQVCAGSEPFPVTLRPQDVDDWLSQYSDHKRVARALAGHFGNCLLAMMHTNDNDLDELLFGDGHRLNGMDLLDDGLWRTAFSRIEIRFFFRVIMPCALHFGVAPTKLLAKVGRGGPDEWDCVEKLMKLDALIVGHKRFARVLSRGDEKQCKERAALMRQCLGKSLRPPTRRKVKVMLAALMSRISELLGHRFDEPDIRALYDAVAKDRGQLRDHDLPESPEALSKAIQRDRSFWELPTELDKQSEDFVRALEQLCS